MHPFADRSCLSETRKRCLQIRAVPIEHKPALRLRIAISFAAIESLVGFRRRSTQRDRALLPSHFHFVSEIWHEVVLTPIKTSRIGAFDSVFPGGRHLILFGRPLPLRRVTGNVYLY